MCLKKNVGVIGMKGLGGGDRDRRAGAGLDAVECLPLCPQPAGGVAGGGHRQPWSSSTQNVALARGFKPMRERGAHGAAGARARTAGDGRFELFKSTQTFDGPHHRRQHGFQPDRGSTGRCSPRLEVDSIGLTGAPQLQRTLRAAAKRARRERAPRSSEVARAVTARVTAASQAVQQPSQPAAPQPSAGQPARARGAEETITRLTYEERSRVRRRARRRTPSSVATSLRLRPARRLPTAGCGRLARPPAPGSSSTASAALDQRDLV